MLDRPPNLFSRRSATRANRFKRSVVAFQAGNAGPRQHFDVGKSSDAVHEIARHARGKIVTAYQQPNLDSLVRQIDCCLPRRILPAHERHLLHTTLLQGGRPNNARLRPRMTPSWELTAAGNEPRLR